MYTCLPTADLPGSSSATHSRKSLSSLLIGMLGNQIEVQAALFGEPHLSLIDSYDPCTLASSRLVSSLSHRDLSPRVESRSMKGSYQGKHLGEEIIHDGMPNT